MNRFVFVFCLICLPALAGADGTADFVSLAKADRELVLWRQGQPIKRYEVALGFAPTGDKQQQGDGRTPEGRYVIDWRNEQSRFHLSLHISYPDKADKADAAERGVDPGGDIFIHGQLRASGWLMRLPYDWTEGCIAVSNAEIEEIWTLVPNGTPIEITP